MGSLLNLYVKTLCVTFVGFSFINFYMLVGGRDDWVELWVVNYDRTPAAEPYDIVKSDFSTSDRKHYIVEKVPKSLAVQSDETLSVDTPVTEELHDILKSDFSTSDATKQIIVEQLPKSLAVQTDEILREKAADLKRMKIRFYMYDDANITLDGSPIIKTLYNRRLQHSNDAEYDEEILATLHKSELRTLEPDEADLFIAPIPMVRIFMTKFMDFHVSFRALVNHEIFRKHNGNNHVLVSTTFTLFRWDIKKHSPMRWWYDKIWNMTVMLSWDPNAVYKDQIDSGDWGEYGLKNMRPVTARSASIGLGSKNDCLKLGLATKENFFNSSNFVFYHSTTGTSFQNSTIYRHAPITNITADDNFPKSSIGWPIEKEEWERNFRDSKFCLTIRGDTPHSHAMWRSIRVGCIPVVSSDHLPIFSPLFKSTLNMSDYCVIVKEQDLVNNPAQTLLKLKELSEDEIEAKIKHLAFAQRVIFSDHPQSLFVEAFLREAKQATPFIPIKK